ncbi:tyrosine-type recombinase/integrase [Mesorhizobium sp. M1050]
MKYKAALGVAYGAGLRVSEVAHLKVDDIDSTRMLIRVEQGKGRRDRIAMLSPQLLEQLRLWWREGKRRGVMLPMAGCSRGVIASRLSRRGNCTARSGSIRRRHLRNMHPSNLREYYFTGPRVMVVSSAITSNALMLNVGSPFISAIIGPSKKAFTAASSSNR